MQSAGVQFPQRPRTIPSSHPSSDANKKVTLNGELAFSRNEGVTLAQQPEPQIVPESRYILLNFFLLFFIHLKHNQILEMHLAILERN